LSYLLVLGCFSCISLSQQTCFGGDEVPSIAGRYRDNYGGIQIINQETWHSDSLLFHICSTSNENRDIIAQNGKHNPYFPNQYSRFEWVEDSSSHLWYCQQVYNANTIEEAASFPKANSSEPSTGGCGTSNFPWTQIIKFGAKDTFEKLKEKPSCSGTSVIPSIAGQYTDNYGGREIVNKNAWRSPPSVWHICSTDNENREIIAQNGEHNSYFPGLYSRFEWVREEVSHDLWYCQQVYNASTEEDASSYPRADSSNPSVGGCGIPSNDFPWTQLIKVKSQNGDFEGNL